MRFASGVAGSTCSGSRNGSFIILRNCMSDIAKSLWEALPEGALEHDPNAYLSSQGLGAEAPLQQSAGTG